MLRRLRRGSPFFEQWETLRALTAGRKALSAALLVGSTVVGSWRSCMWIVKLALRRPYTFVVAALLILLLGIVSIRNTPTDIFPVIDIPVISVIWTYNGLSTPEMESRIALYSEFSISAAVNDVKDIESQTLSGVSVIKIFFHPTVSIDTEMEQFKDVWVES